MTRDYFSPVIQSGAAVGVYATARRGYSYGDTHISHYADITRPYADVTQTLHGILAGLYAQYADITRTLHGIHAGLYTNYADLNPARATATAGRLAVSLPVPCTPCMFSYHLSTSERFK